MKEHESVGVQQGCLSDADLSLRTLKMDFSEGFWQLENYFTTRMMHILFSWCNITRDNKDDRLPSVLVSSERSS